MEKSLHRGPAPSGGNPDVEWPEYLWGDLSPPSGVNPIPGHMDRGLDLVITICKHKYTMKYLSKSGKCSN